MDAALGSSPNVFINDNCQGINTIFNPLEFSFHTPSENAIDGVRSDAEIQLLHQDANGTTSIVSWLFDIDVTADAGAGAFLDGLQAAVEARDDVDNSTTYDLANLLPFSGQQFYRFYGSLTTPPCTENIYWNLIDTPLTITQDQFDFIKTYVTSDNARNLQPFNNRLLTTGTVVDFNEALCIAQTQG